MIDITFQPNQLIIDQINVLSLKLTNLGDKVCTHVNLRLRLPPQIVLLEGRDKIEDAKIDSGQNIILTVHVRPKQVGSWIIGSSSFSYRDNLGRSHHPAPLQGEIEVIPLTPAQKLQEPAHVEITYSAERGRSKVDDQLTSVPVEKPPEIANSQFSKNYRGNTIAVNKTNVSAPKIFISYSHADEKYMTRLVSMLKPLEKQGVFKIWHDRAITPGNEWYQDIQNAINTCDLAMLLISIDFLNSRFIQEDELPRLLQLRKQKGLRVVPIIVRHCIWTSVPILKDLQALPKDGRPVISFTGSGQPDRIWAEIAKVIEELSKTLPLENRSGGD
jgi:hypothetical protein